ncbi:MAG: hypothetical protein KatS3mg111_1556 [Pirellulaceae bacterium]|nr:MAG: hypothetical protein KatS3mg111_1556 [Pirellulaceae bacterium]
MDVDDAGNLITDIASEQLEAAPRDESVRIIVDEHETLGLYPPDHSQPEMTLVAVVAPGQPLTIVLVGDSASTMLGVRTGASVMVQW